MTINHTLNALRTIRHLRCSQIAWRVRYMLERYLQRTTGIPGKPRRRRQPLDMRLARFPDVPLFHRPGPTGERAVSNLLCGVFEHLNHAQAVPLEQADHRGRDVSRNRLWEITLEYHYWFYDLAEAAMTGRPLAFSLLHQYLSRWLDACESVDEASPFTWNAFAIATRISWWVRALRMLGDSTLTKHREFADRVCQSLCQQAEYLFRHVEWDLRGNHVMRDTVGLAWAGRLFEGQEAERWMAKATRIGVDQAGEQVLPDGGHFERSPMYHVHVMEDVLSLAILLRDPVAQRAMRETWRRMAEYLAWVRRPDGLVPLFNDGAHFAVCSPNRMLRLGETIGVGVDTREGDGPHLCEAPFRPFRQIGSVPLSLPRGGRFFADSGLAIWHGSPWTMHCDVGPVGPDYQPGHAHADNLTFECCYHGEPLIVDPGTYAYDNDDRRKYDRATRSHNTVGIDEMDSSEVWHIFRVGRRAKPVDVQVQSDNRSIIVSGSHDGYSRLPGRPQHTRWIEVQDGGRLTVRDRVVGGGSHTVEAGFLLSPGWNVRREPSGWALEREPEKDDNGLLSEAPRVPSRETAAGSPSRPCRVRVHCSGQPGLELRVEARPYHPEYGKEMTTDRLMWRSRADLPIEVVTVFEAG